MTHRPPIVTGEARVASARAIAPHVLRVTIAGEALRGYRPARPAEAIRLMLPPPGATRVDFPTTGDDGLPRWGTDQVRPTLRGLTIRGVPGPGQIELDVMERDGDDRWRRWLRPGALVGVSGTRFGYAGPLAAAHHALVGDRSALPAIAAVLERLPADVRTSVVVASTTSSDRPLLPRRAGVELRWVDAPQAADALRDLLDDARPDHLYAAGEVALVAAAHRLGREHLGLPPVRVQPIVYWQRGLSADERDPRVFDRYHAAALDGRDVSDPAIVADLELTPVATERAPQ